MSSGVMKAIIGDTLQLILKDLKCNNANNCQYENSYHY